MGDDAQKMLNEWIAQKDIVEAGGVIAKLHGLRQQQVQAQSGGDAKESEQEYCCMSDFIAPTNEHGIRDYIGMFAVSAGFGIQSLVHKYKVDATDDYSALLAQALADRLGEAFAEKMHFDVRRRYWHYEEPKSRMSATDLHKIKYCGIRPAPGYPMQPDSTEQATIWKLLDVEKHCQIKLTDHFAMDPA